MAKNADQIVFTAEVVHAGTSKDKSVSLAFADACRAPVARGVGILDTIRAKNEAKIAEAKAKVAGALEKTANSIANIAESAERAQKAWLGCTTAMEETKTLVLSHHNQRNELVREDNVAASLYPDRLAKARKDSVRQEEQADAAHKLTMQELGNELYVAEREPIEDYERRKELKDAQHRASVKGCQVPSAGAAGQASAEDDERDRAEAEIITDNVAKKYVPFNSSHLWHGAAAVQYWGERLAGRPHYEARESTISHLVTMFQNDPITERTAKEFHNRWLELQEEIVQAETARKQAAQDAAARDRERSQMEYEEARHQREMQANVVIEQEKRRAAEATAQAAASDERAFRFDN